MENKQPAQISSTDPQVQPPMESPQLAYPPVLRQRKIFTTDNAVLFFTGATLILFAVAELLDSLQGASQHYKIPILELSYEGAIWGAFAISVLTYLLSFILYFVHVGLVMLGKTEHSRKAGICVLLLVLAYFIVSTLDI